MRQNGKKFGQFVSKWQEATRNLSQIGPVEGEGSFNALKVKGYG